jgi:hypothetical protein
MTVGFQSRRSGIISADQAFEQLGPERLEMLNDAVLSAWDRYKTGIAPVMGKPGGRLRATAMQQLMVEEIEKRFGGEVLQRHGRALLCAVPGLVVQMKKLNDRGLPSNYPTKTAIRFAAQLQIPGMPPGTRLTLGYLLDSLGTAIAEVRLIAQLGNGVAWSREIGAASSQYVIPFNGVLRAAESGVRATETPAPKQRRLQPKGTVAAKKERKPGA